jgi:uncharacterized protein YjdB
VSVLGFTAVLLTTCSFPLSVPERESVYQRPVIQSLKFSSPNNTPPTLTFQEGSTVAQTVAVGFMPADFPDKTLVWTSLNKKVIITSTGPNTAQVLPATGTQAPIAGDKDTIVAVPVGGGAVKTTCAVEFTGASAVPAQSISLDQTSLSLPNLDTTALTVTIVPNTASVKTVNWLITTTGAGTATFSSGGTSATTNGDGSSVNIVGGTPGTGVVVKATLTDGSKTFTATCDVTVTDTRITQVNLDHPTLHIIAGGTAVLQATTLPAGATDSTVAWSRSNTGASLTALTHSGDTSTATINVGSLTAGTSFTVTATSDEDSTKSAQCTVTVDPVATALTLTPSSQLMMPGETFQIGAVAVPVNAAVTWTSSAGGVAIVDQTGFVTAVSAGSATITATSGSLTRTCNVTVGGWQAPLGGGAVPSVVGNGVKMAVDSTGKPYLAYVDPTGAGQLLVFSGGNWVTPTGGGTFSTSVVTPNSAVSPYPSLGSAGSNIAMAIDSNNNVYVAYPEIVASVKQLTISKYDGTGWSVVGNPSTDALSSKPTGEPRFLSMAADGTTLFLAFADGGAGVGGASGNNFGATILTWNGTAWALVGTRGGTNAPELYLSLAVNPVNHASILAAVNNGSFEAYQGNSVIGFSTPSPVPTQPRFLSLAIDTAGTMYVGLQRAENGGAATVIKSTGANWSFFTSALGTGAVSTGTANDVTMAIGNGTTPYIAYQDVGAGNIATVMKFNGTSWVSMTAGLNSGPISDVAIVADPTGPGLFVAYVDSSGSITVKRLQ